MSGTRAVAVVLVVLAVLAVGTGSTAPGAAATVVPAGPSSGPLCGVWVAIGDTPTPAELARAASYRVIVLNPWETDALATIRRVAPETTVLAYKDLASTRSYAGALGDGGDAALLPTGVGYAEADREHPEWFARDPAGRRIQWDPFPGSWQMAVWEPGYQQRWADNVTADVVRDGWDGVLADNDMTELRYYSEATFAEAPTAEATDQLLRDGLDGLVTRAGTELAAAGKLFVPNVSAARLHPGLWERHARFGGAMEETFAFFPPDDVVVGPEWSRQTVQGAGPGLALLFTKSTDPRVQRYAFASAALVAGRGTCWAPVSRPNWVAPEWSELLDLRLGAPVGPARQEDGVWTRRFAGGWVAVNPTGSTRPVTPPTGWGQRTALRAADALVLVDRRS